MPKQTQKSGLMAKYGPKLDAGVKQHGGDKTEYSKFGELPGGIVGGIAKVVDCKFDTYKTGTYQGEYFFYIAAAVVTPEEGPGGEPIVGLRTNLTIPVCDTKKADGTVVAQEERIAEILNEMRKLGASTEGCGGAELEALAEAIKEAAPYTRFSTSAGKKTPEYPTPRVFHNWGGSKGLENFAPPEGSDVEDNTGDEAPASEPDDENVPFGDDLDMLVDRAKAEDAEAQQELSRRAHEAGVGEDADSAENWDAVVDLIRGASGAEDTAQEAAEGAGDEAPDYTALGEAADGGDEEAATALTDAASAAGMDVDSADFQEMSWAEVAEKLSAEPEEDKTPVVGNVVKYAPRDPKTGKVLTNSKTKKAVKATDHEIMSVNAKNETVTLKDLATDKVLAGADKKALQIKWDVLEE